jgi:hypothetical protein
MITSDLGATIHHGDQLLYKIDTVLVAKTPMISLSRGNDLDEEYYILPITETQAQSKLHYESPGYLYRFRQEESWSVGKVSSNCFTPGGGGVAGLVRRAFSSGLQN